jgi:hypothetical protein
MFNRVSSLILTLLLLMIFWWSAQAVNPSSLTVFVVSLGLFIVSTFIVNIRRLGTSWPHLMLPVFYLLGMGSIFMVLTTSAMRLLFLIPAAFVFYMIELELGRESHFLQNVFLFSAFAIFVGLFGLQFYFHLNYIWMTLLIFFASYGLIMQGFAGFSLPVKKYFSFLIAFVCAQAAWGLSLWPTYYVVNALIAFSIFYLLWIFSFSAFFGKLTRNKIYWQLGLVLIILAVTLSTTSFRPLSR